MLMVARKDICWIYKLVEVRSETVFYIQNLQAMSEYIYKSNITE